MLRQEILRASRVWPGAGALLLPVLTVLVLVLAVLAVLELVDSRFLVLAKMREEARNTLYKPSNVLEGLYQPIVFLGRSAPVPHLSYHILPGLRGDRTISGRRRRPSAAVAEGN